jgi:hypothetical protein
LALRDIRWGDDSLQRHIEIGAWVCPLRDTDAASD